MSTGQGTTWVLVADAELGQPVRPLVEIWPR
jgi:hypothetical protein